MLIKRRAVIWVLACLATGTFGFAAVPTPFAPLDDGSAIVWSVRPLNAGDVVEVHAFKAEPGTIVLLAICGDRCENAHIVKHVPVYREQISVVTERYTLEEGGHLAFWAVRPPRLDLNAGGSKAISDDSRNQVSGVLHSGFSGLYNDGEVLHISRTEIDDDRVKVRFDGGRYVTVSRISTAGQTNPPMERK